MSTNKVLVALSGGVDSSVAVHLLREQGYEVEGVILEFSPAHKSAVEAASVIAEQLNVPLHIIPCSGPFCSVLFSFILNMSCFHLLSAHLPLLPHASGLPSQSPH